ncbi:MAG: sulfate ABC transporter permease subunit CysT [Myxococcales bacterium]|nr:sulfate ABC transporter permease subunit CysT [Myxococcales bacterium]
MSVASTLDGPASGRHSRVVSAIRLPGFGLSMGIAMTALGLVVILPLTVLVFRAFSLDLGDLWGLLTAPRALAAFRLSLGTALAAALIDVILGFAVVWVLVRYPFPGRRLVDALVDLPFALPTSVAGITLTTLWSQNGAFGTWAHELGIEVAFTPLGITAALVFVGFPFAVRAVQPVLEALEREPEEAALCLGATRAQVFWRVVLPPLIPAVLTGFTLAFARAVGEYGSVVFIAGNMPGKTEIAPLLVVTRLEQYDYAGAAAIGAALVFLSLLLLIATNLLERWTRKKSGALS